MNRQPSRRSVVGAKPARRIRPPRAANLPGHPDHLRPAVPEADRAALALLSDILVGEREWTVGEVRRLLSMRDAAELGRWRTGPDGDAAGAG